MLRDILGNEVRPGTLLYWATTNTVVKVADLNDSQMLLAITIPLPKDGALREFVAVVNPAQQQAVEKMMKDAPVGMGAAAGVKS